MLAAAANYTAETVTSDRDWSAQQKAVFAWFANGHGNLVVRARAGTGKTTTILEGISYAPEREVVLCAFSKRIATELQERLTHPTAQARTLHSIGAAIVRRWWHGVRIERDDCSGERARSLAAEACGFDCPDEIVKLVQKLHTLGREMAPLAQRGRDLHAIAYNHDLVPDDEWRADGYGLEYVCTRAVKAMQLATDKARALATGIDFSDMLYLPVRLGWARPRYDLVVVDEAQDMNLAQLLLAQRIARGRIAVVGDDRQAIYGFRGADSGSIDRLKTELDANELGLTTTYRCGKSIVAMAAGIVPDFVAAAGNTEGSISDLPMERLASSALPGDFVLSRKNAPLVGVALSVLRQGKRCRVQGRDIGKGLVALVQRLAKGDGRSVPGFLGKLASWQERETKRAEAAAPSPERAARKVDEIADKADTLRHLAEGMDSVRAICERIESLFSDSDRLPSVVCNSVHRAKGLEADRVFVLADTLRSGSIEEDNIRYVAITRARHELVWVLGE